MATLVVLIGVRGAGKTTVLNGLSSKGYCVLQPSTTRAPRTAADTEYDYTTHTAWHTPPKAWQIHVGPEIYGMRESEIAKVIQKGFAFTVFEPSNLHVLQACKDQLGIDVITVGLDTVSTIEIQHQRIGTNISRKMTEKDFFEQRIVVLKCDAVVTGKEADVLASILSIAKINSGRGGVVDGETIKSLIGSECLLKGAIPENVSVASYDLSLGDNVWIQGTFINLSEENAYLKIPAYSYAIVSAREIAALPNFICGRFDLKVSLFFQGVVLSNGPQVDPGYRGALFCMLYNGSDNSVAIARGEHFSTIEFSTTSQNTLGYSNKHQNRTKIQDFMPAHAAVGHGGRLFETLQKKIKKVERRVAIDIPILLGVVAIVVTTIFSFVAYFYQELKDIEARSADQLSSYASSISQDQQTIAFEKSAIQAQIKTLMLMNQNNVQLENQLNDEIKKHKP